jgi:hypothetical protein
MLVAAGDNSVCHCARVGQTFTLSLTRVGSCGIQEVGSVQIHCTVAEARMVLDSWMSGAGMNSSGVI